MIESVVHSLLSPINQCSLTGLEHNKTPLISRKSFKLYIDNYEQRRMIALDRHGTMVAGLIINKHKVIRYTHYVPKHEDYLQSLFAYCRCRFGNIIIDY